MCIRDRPYYDDDELTNLSANSLQRGEDDAPVVDHPKSHDVQKVLKIMRDQLEAQEDYCLVLPSKSLAFLTLVA